MNEKFKCIICDADTSTVETSDLKFQYRGITTTLKIISQFCKRCGCSVTYPTHSVHNAEQVRNFKKRIDKALKYKPRNIR